MTNVEKITEAKCFLFDKEMTLRKFLKRLKKEFGVEIKTKKLKNMWSSTIYGWSGSSGCSYLDDISKGNSILLCVYVAIERLRIK